MKKPAILLFCCLHLFRAYSQQPTVFHIKIVLNYAQGDGIENLPIRSEPNVINSQSVGNGLYVITTDQPIGSRIQLSLGASDYMPLEPAVFEVKVPLRDDRPDVFILCRKKELRYWLSYYVTLRTAESNPPVQYISPQKRTTADNPDQTPVDIKSLLVDGFIRAESDSVDKEDKFATQEILFGDPRKAITLLRHEKPFENIDRLKAQSDKIGIAIRKKVLRIERMGDAYSSLLKVDSALYCYKTAAKYDSTNVLVFLKVIYLLSSRGEMDEYYTWVQRVLAIKTNNPDDKAYQILTKINIYAADILHMNERILDSVQDEIRQLGVLSDNCRDDVNSRLGDFYLVLGFDEKALSCFRDCLESPAYLNEQQISIVNTLKDHYEKQNDWRHADSINDIFMAKYRLCGSEPCTTIYKGRYLAAAYDKAKYQINLKHAPPTKAGDLEFDTTALNEAFWNMAGELAQRPNAESESRFATTLLDFASVIIEAKYPDSGDCQSFYTRLCDTIRSARIRYDFSYSFSLLHLFLSIIYRGDAFLAPKQQPSPDRNVIDNYISALNYADKKTGQDSFYCFLVDDILEFQHLIDSASRTDQAYRLAMEKLLTKYHHLSGPASYQNTIVLSRFAECDFLGESKREELRSEIFTAFQSLILNGAVDDNLLNRYKEFILDWVNQRLDRRDYALAREILTSAKTLIERKVISNPYNLQYFILLGTLTSKLVDVYTRMGNNAVTETFIMTLLTAYRRKIVDYPGFGFTLTTLLMVQIPEYIVRHWKSDTSSSARWVKYYNDLRQQYKTSIVAAPLERAELKMLEDIKLVQVDSIIKLVKADTSAKKKIDLIGSALQVMKDSSYIRIVDPDLSLKDYHLVEYKALHARTIDCEMLAGHVMIRRGKYKNATSLAQLALQSDSNCVQCKILLAHSLLFSGQEEHALQLYDGVKNAKVEIDSISTFGRDLILTDLKDFKAAGVSCPGQERLLAHPTVLMDIERRVKESLALKLDKEPEDIKVTSSFTKDLEVDDSDKNRIILEIAKEFNVVIPEANLKNLETVGQLIAYLESNISA